MVKTSEMKHSVPQLPLSLLSPAKRVRAELSVETVWIGTAVYPECPVWRVWYDGRPVVDTSTVGLMTDRGPLAYGMRLVKATRHRPQTGIGPGRAIRARFAARDGRELEVTLRITDLSAFCAVRELRKRLPAVTDIGSTCFPEGSVLLEGRETFNPPSLKLREASAQGSNPISDLRPPTSDLSPQVRFVPSGKLVAWWRHGTEQHAVFFDRPGDLGARRFGALEKIGALNVESGRQGCEHLFLTVPFTKAALPDPSFGEAVTPAYRGAFEMILGRGSASDDFWVIRGEPGEFAVAARRFGGTWQVGGVTADAQTLTVRFEDLWLRTPPELRALVYSVALVRDPTAGEAGNRVDESFQSQAPDVRVALDVKKDGGFLLTFRPQDELKP